MSSLTDDQSKIGAARAGFVDAWRLMADNLQHGAWAEHDGLAIAATGLELAPVNPVMAVRAPADPEAALAYARAFYAERGLPWMLYAADDAADALAPAAASAGLTPDDPEPALILDLPPAKAPLSIPGLDIQAGRDETTLRDFVATASTAFGTTPDSLTIWANPDLLDTLGLAFYLGFLDGKPVTTSALFAQHGIATVNMVSTLPDYRRRGLAEAMTWHAAMAGFRAGCVASYLHASEMGLSLYQRMGYRPLVTYQTWINPHTL